MATNPDSEVDESAENPGDAFVQQFSDVKDSVSQKLEENGTLARLQAQMRAAVYFALDPNNIAEKSKSTNSTPYSNSKLSSFLQTKNGQVSVEVIREFLQFFGLESTDKVFTAEIALKNKEAPNRKEIANELRVPSNSSNPLLEDMVQTLQSTSGSKGLRQAEHRSPMPANDADMQRVHDITERIRNLHRSGSASPTDSMIKMSSSKASAKEREPSTKEESRFSPPSTNQSEPYSDDFDDDQISEDIVSVDDDSQLTSNS